MEYPIASINGQLAAEIKYLKEELEAAHAELRLYQAKLGTVSALEAENGRLRACLEGFKLALELVGRWPRTVNHVKQVLGETACNGEPINGDLSRYENEGGKS